MLTASPRTQCWAGHARKLDMLRLVGLWVISVREWASESVPDQTVIGLREPHVW